MGSSQLPGTDCTMIFDSFTPEARSLALVPATRGSIIAEEDWISTGTSQSRGEVG
jgi:hypothetical protein